MVDNRREVSFEVTNEGRHPLSTTTMILRGKLEIRLDSSTEEI